MRQAGRHLSTYRALRQHYSFLEMCHQADLIEQITCLPVDRYGVDAAILFSDILLIPKAMGVGVRFEDQKGPIIDRPLNTELDVDAISDYPDLSSLSFLSQAIKQLKQKLSVPLIGFCGAPFTIASYMIEGHTSRDLTKTKQWMYRNPSSFRRLLSKIANWSIDYLKLQAEAGVQAAQIFDSWANALDHFSFREYSLVYLKKILDGLHATKIPVILFCRGSSVFATQLAELKPQGISLDWNCHLPQMRQAISSSIALQGNFDPMLLYASKEMIDNQVSALLSEMKHEKGFIVNLGHGLPPDVSEEAVEHFIHSCKQFSSNIICHTQS